MRTQGSSYEDSESHDEVVQFSMTERRRSLANREAISVILPPQSFSKLRFCGRNFPRFFQAASHFLPPELKVRLREEQSSAPMVKLSYHWAEQPIFCISPKAKLPNFRKESDNCSVLHTVCPKAITP